MGYEATVARRLQFDVDLGSIAVPSWQEILGVLEAKPSREPNHEEDADHAGGGWDDPVVTAEAWSVELKLSHRADEDTNLFHPTHESLEAASKSRGAAARRRIRYYDRFGRPGGCQGTALVTWAPEGGDHKATDQIAVTLTGKKELIDITNPLNETPVPIVATATPGTDVAAGGARVVIRGAYFTGTTTVKFGSTTAPGFTVIDDGVIVVNAPAHAAGSAPVTVTNANGVSTTSAPFTYTA